MKYLDYHEKRRQGTFEFPVAFYHLTQSHPRYEMPYHWHKEYEIIHVVKGNFNMIIDDNIHPLASGDIVLLQDGVLHGGTPVECVYECIVFNMDFLLTGNHLHKELIDDILNHHIQIQQILPKNRQPLQTTVDQLFQLMGTKPTGYEFIVKGYLLQILGLVINNKWYAASPTKFEKVTHQIVPLKKVLKKIESDYSNPISLDDLANEAGMNPRYFCKYFKKLTQRSPIEYLNYYRIECACEQLLTTSASITEIALNCGFNEVSYFIRTFKKFKGTTPNQYKTLEFGDSSVSI